MLSIIKLMSVVKDVDLMPSSIFVNDDDDDDDDDMVISRLRAPSSCKQSRRDQDVRRTSKRCH